MHEGELRAEDKRGNRRADGVEGEEKEREKRGGAEKGEMAAWTQKFGLVSAPVTGSAENRRKKKREKDM